METHPLLGRRVHSSVVRFRFSFPFLFALALLRLADVGIEVFATTAIGAGITSGAADPGLSESTTTSPVIDMQTDDVAPAVAISSPATGATVSGAVIPIAANASDNVGVTGVQFLLDGTSLGPEDATAPYATGWDTTQTSNGPHVLTAIARDEAGNQTISSAVLVTVENVYVPPPGSALPVTDFLDMENGIVGDLVTAQLAAGATHGTSGTWQEGPYYAAAVPHQLKVAAIPPRPPRALVQVGSTVYPDAGSQGYVKKTTRETDAEFHRYVFAVPKPLKVSVGFFMYFSGEEDGWRGDTWDYYDVFVLEGLAGINYHAFNVQTSGGNDGTPLRFTNHTDDGCSGGLEVLQARVDQWYWVTMLYDYSGTNRSATMEIYDPDAWQRIGRGVCNLPAVPANQRSLDSVAVGQYDNHNNPTTNSYYYLDDLLIDATGSIFPLVPAVSADREAPTVAVTAPAAGSAVSGAVTLSADAADNTEVTQVQFVLDDAALGSPLTTPPFSTVWNASAALGPHTLTATARDAAGNTSVAPLVAFEVVAAPPDTTPPVISDISTSNTTSSDTRISWVTNELSDGRVTLWSNGSDGLLQVDSHLVTTHVFDLSLLTPATTYTYVVASTDPAGNSATSAEQAFITLADTTGPVVSLNEPVNGAIVSGADVTVAATVTDQSSIAGVQFKLDGQDLGMEDSTSPYASSWNTMQTSNGVHVLSAVARDAVGNVGVSVATVTVSNDYTPPLVSLTSPANNATVSGTVTVSANASDNVGVTGVRFQVDGTNLGAEDLVAPFSIAWNTTAASNGTHVLTAVARDAAGNATTSAPRTVTVSTANSAPTISNIPNQTISEDTVMGPVNFTVGDPDTPAGNLTLTGTSSNTARVPNGNIVFGGSGANRTVTVTPAANQTGNSTITVTVSDGSKTATDTFTLSVSAVNDAPTVSDIADRITNEDTSTGAISFTVSDVEKAATSLTVTRASSNPTLVPLANVVLGGSGANRTVTVTPAVNQSGTAAITVTVSDGALNTGDTFVVTVTPVNDSPTISNIVDRTISGNTSTGAIAFTVGDVETAAGSLTLTGASSNPTLVPDANIVFGGSGSSRTVTVTPAANQTGTATITVTVNDGTASASDTFVLTVTDGSTPAYLLSESFEGVGFENAGWSLSGTPNANYTTTALEGLESLNTIGTQYVWRSFVNATTFSMYFQVRWNSWTHYTSVVNWDDANWSAAAGIWAGANRLYITHGTTDAFGTTPVNPNTTYHVWVEWTKGTGTNGTMALYVSTTATKPAAADATITTGRGAATQRIYLGANAAAPNLIFDRVRIAAVPIGSNP